LPAFVGSRPTTKRPYERGVKLIGCNEPLRPPSNWIDGPIIEQDTVRISHRRNQWKISSGRGAIWKELCWRGGPPGSVSLGCCLYTRRKRLYSTEELQTSLDGVEIAGVGNEISGLILVNGIIRCVPARCWAKKLGKIFIDGCGLALPHLACTNSVRAIHLISRAPIFVRNEIVDRSLTPSGNGTGRTLPAFPTRVNDHPMVFTKTLD